MNVRAAFLLAVSTLSACSHEPAVRFRYVVVISLDTVRADRLGCYGNVGAKTPNLDALAARGVRFEHAITAAPTTLASHASMMTGLYPHHHGVPRNGFVLSAENHTLAEILRENGFETAAFLGSFALASPFGLKQGFDVYDERFETELGQNGVDQSQRDARAVTDTALRWFEETEPERAFLFLHYFDAHAPYAPKASSEPAITLATLSQRARAHQTRWMSSPPGWEAPLSTGLPRELVGAPDGSKLDATDDTIVAQHDREISELDAELARVFEHFSTPERAAQTLLVVVADHGESFYEHADFFNHGLWLHDTTVRVPLIVTANGVAPRAVATPVSTVDLTPTILEFLRDDLRIESDGVSLVPMLLGQSIERGSVFSEATQPTHPSIEKGTWVNTLKPSCIVEGRWKLIRVPYLHLEQLFDLENDPGERVDLLRDGAPAAPAILAELRAKLDAWEGSARPLPSQFERGIADETARKLRELGYTENETR